MKLFDNGERVEIIRCHDCVHFTREDWSGKEDDRILFLPCDIKDVPVCRINEGYVDKNGFCYRGRKKQSVKSNKEKLYEKSGDE